MKQCPKCNDFALYNDSIALCPICNTRLVAYAGTANTDHRVVEPESTPRRENYTRAPRFETVSGNTHTFRGMVTEISHQSRWNTRFKKIVNSLFRSEPYQFGNTTQETVIRIEEFTNGDRMPSARRDMIFYGEAEGRVTYGDDVEVRARYRNGRFIVKNLRVNDTGEVVRPSVQIPALVIKLTAVFIVLFIISLVAGIVEIITSGAIPAFFSGLAGGLLSFALQLLGALAPFIIIYFIIRSLFR